MAAARHLRQKDPQLERMLHIHGAHCKAAEGFIHACAQGMAMIVPGFDQAV